MIKKKLIISIVIFCLFGCFLINKKIDSAELSNKKAQALREWEDIFYNADFHIGALKDMKKIIVNTETNIPDLIEISKMISIIPFQTIPLLNVARQAAHAKNENIDFLQIAELSVIKLSESESVEKLAEYAAGIDSDEDLTEYTIRYDSLRKSADADTIEEAVDRVNKMIQLAKETASSL